MEELDTTKKVTLETPMDELENKILSSTDLNELKDIVNIFNLNIQKKNIVRLNKLNQIQDLIANQIEERVKNKADQFDNQDLISYFKTVQETINKSDNSLDSIDTPAIQVIQNQLNINVQQEDSLDRDSRERIMDAVKAILSKANNADTTVLNTDYEEVKEDFND